MGSKTTTTATTRTRNSLCCIVKCLFTHTIARERSAVVGGKGKGKGESIGECE